MITSVSAKNYMGITFREERFGAAGAIIQGGNARGKTSLLKAITTALTGAGADASCVRKGADKAEVIVEVDETTISRVISREGKSTLKVTRPGVTVNKPATFLAALFGSTLDPLAFFLAKPGDRRTMLLDTMPCVVTPAQIVGWVPEFTEAGVTSFLKCPVQGAADPLPIHGLVAVETLRAALYAQRTDANKATKEAIAAADAAVAAVAAAQAELAARVPGVDAADVADEASAKRALDAANEGQRAIVAQAEEAARAIARQAKTRDTIAARRAEADRIVAEAPALPTEEEYQAAEKAIADAVTNADACRAEIVDLEKRLVLARAALADATSERANAGQARSALDDRRRAHEGAAARAKQLGEMIASFEADLEDVQAPTVDQREAAAEAVRVAQDALGTSVTAARVRIVRAARSAAESKAIEAKTRADALDRAVKTLSTRAPAELMAASNGIPGVSLDGDEIQLDGVSIDRLSGAEQMKLAIEIARRANVKSKVLIVDGFERIDADQREVFAQLATADGYQLIATRVTRGDLDVQPIAAAMSDVAEAVS